MVTPATTVAPIAVMPAMMTAAIVLVAMIRTVAVT